MNLLDLNNWQILLIVFAAAGAWWKLNTHSKMLEKHDAADQQLRNDVTELKTDVKWIKDTLAALADKLTHK